MENEKIIDNGKSIDSKGEKEGVDPCRRMGLDEERLNKYEAIFCQGTVIWE